MSEHGEEYIFFSFSHLRGVFFTTDVCSISPCCVCLGTLVYSLILDDSVFSLLLTHVFTLSSLNCPPSHVVFAFSIRLIRLLTRLCAHHKIETKKINRLLESLKGQGGGALEKMQGHAAFLKASEVGQGLKDARAVRILGDGSIRDVLRLK